MKICWKCNKKLKENELVLGYNHYFCKECYKQFKKEAKKEVGRALDKLEKDGFF